MRERMVNDSLLLFFSSSADREARPMMVWYGAWTPTTTVLLRNAIFFSTHCVFGTTTWLSSSFILVSLIQLIEMDRRPLLKASKTASSTPETSMHDESDHNDSSFHHSLHCHLQQSDMSPSKNSENCEVIIVPLRGSPQKEKVADLEKGQSYSNKTNFLVSGASVKAVSSCLLYSFCSVSMILVNKSLASR